MAAPVVEHPSVLNCFVGTSQYNGFKSPTILFTYNEPLRDEIIKICVAKGLDLNMPGRSHYSASPIPFFDADCGFLHVHAAKAELFFDALVAVQIVDKRLVIPTILFERLLQDLLEKGCLSDSGVRLQKERVRVIEGREFLEPEYRFLCAEKA